ncbi:MAG: NADH-quinone oxidoreductase subunit J [Planctomycetota bacterium]
MNLVFAVAGLLAVISAGCAVFQKSPIYAALFTLCSLGAVAAEFALLHAPFLAAMQILLYAGAIMVLFVFVIMLLNLSPEEHGDEPSWPQRIFAGLVAGTVFLILVKAIGAYPVRDPNFAVTEAVLARREPEFGSVAHFGHFLYGSSVVPFELVSVLLTAALAAVLILARKRSPILDTPAAAPAVDHGHGHAHGDGQDAHGHAHAAPVELKH